LGHSLGRNSWPIAQSSLSLREASKLAYRQAGKTTSQKNTFKILFSIAFLYELDKLANLINFFAYV